VETLIEVELFGIEERTATGVRGRRGKFELADGGTLFLDEIGDLSVVAQAKLLRVLQDMAVERVGSHILHVFDTRVVAATNRGLLDMVAARQFRPDLYYRLSGVEITVPPLRTHGEDVPLLVDHFLRRSGGYAAKRVTPEAMRVLTGYQWPGNVRQLERVLERAIALGSGRDITLEDLPDHIRLGSDGAVPVAGPINDRSLRAWSHEYVRAVLDSCKGNKRRACDVLDITYHTLMSHLASRRPSPAAVAPARPGKQSPGCETIAS